MTIKIGILEDNRKMAEDLKSQFFTWAKNNGYEFQVYIFQNSTDFISSISKEKYAFCFLDIQLDATNPTASNGLDVAKQIRQNNYSGDLVFLTSYHEYVFEGYNVNAFNFLLKPIEPKKIDFVLSALLQKHKQHYYILKNKQKIQNIPYHDIITFSSNLHHTIIMTADQNYYDQKSLTEIMIQLPPDFIQCHRSCIVNLNHIIKIEHSTIYLTNRLTQSISRKHLIDVKNAYLDYILGEYK